MAARKSCTHLTWAEAKNKSGISTGVKKNKEYLRKQNHGTLQAQKIISKHGVDDSETRKLQKVYRKLDEKSAAIAAQREEEREQPRLEALQEDRPYERAKEKCAELMQHLRMKGLDAGESIVSLNDVSTDDTTVVECKRMQLDEIIALEALIPEDEFCLIESSDIQGLRQKFDEMDAGNDVSKSIVQHPRLSLLIQLEVEGSLATPSDELMDLTALIILYVGLPPLYLNSDDGLSEVPSWRFRHVMVTDKDIFCSADKPLESMAWLDEKAILQAMTDFARGELVPYPCVYEVAVTWLSEHLFKYLNLHPHLLLAETK